MTWTIDLDALTAIPDCDICRQSVCDNYRTCRDELAALLERSARRSVRPDRTGART